MFQPEPQQPGTSTVAHSTVSQQSELQSQLFQPQQEQPSTSTITPPQSEPQSQLTQPQQQQPSTSKITSSSIVDQQTHDPMLGCAQITDEAV